MCKNRSGDVHGVDKAQALFHAALLHRRLDLAGDIDEVIALLRVHPEVFGVEFHGTSPINFVTVKCHSTLQ